MNKIILFKMDEKHAVYIIVNDDLKMSVGKIASQVGHLTEKMAETIMTSLYESTNTGDLEVTYLKYVEEGRKKVVLKGHYKDMISYLSDKDCVSIIDEGLTEIPPDSLTVIGFYPSKFNKERFKKFRLINEKLE